MPTHHTRPSLPRTIHLVLATAAASALALAIAGAQPPAFELVQPDLFAASGGQPNAWADFDGDDDLDLFVGFREGAPNRLYQNTGGQFTDVAVAMGLADTIDTRAAAWGDFDGNGDVDLFVGFTRKSNTPARLYRNDGPGKGFTDVAATVGVGVTGEIRQSSFVDIDGDRDLDLFVAVRDAPNMLFRNDGGRFASVGRELGLDDARRTVGAVWFDMDVDGDLDLFVANQNGDLNGLFRNDRTRFVDVAGELGVAAAGRAPTSGSNGPSVADFDYDGDLDLFVAGYGGNYFYRNDGRGTFTEIASQVGLAGGGQATPSRWGDIDNDGRIDLYVSSYDDTPVNERDFLFHNVGGRFVNALPPAMATHGATHGIQWIDFDRDGDLDLSVANNNPKGTHALHRNLLPAPQRAQAVQVTVLDEQGHARHAGAEVRVYAAGTRTLLGMGLVDSGGGYCSQNVAPVHVGLGREGAVDIEVTTLSGQTRQVMRLAGVTPARLPRLIVKAP